MSLQSEQLKQRTMAFALEVLRLLDDMPNTHGGLVIGRQLAKSATSVGANYRACCNARSRQEFVAKLGVVVEEIDETAYWLELASGARLRPAPALVPLQEEAAELRAIFARSLGTARFNLRTNQNKINQSDKWNNQ